MRILTAGLFLLLASVTLRASDTLDAYFVDVEGGQATLVVSPSGESLLVDTGWPGFDGRDAERIVAAARAAGVKRIDYLVITHYHTDHVGGAPELAKRIPIVHFVDHGASVESGDRADTLFAAYSKVRDTGKHLEVKPGDRIPISGIDVEVVTAGGEGIAAPLAGAGEKNSLCATTPRGKDDPSENARSVGILIRYGKFRMIDLGDLSWNKELDLVCPENRLGKVDVYLTTHHGGPGSGPAAIVHALRPRVAVMNNGARKGAGPEAWQVVRRSPGLEDLWQVHYALEAGSKNNVPEVFISNVEENCRGYGIKLSARSDGSFTVTNPRTAFSKQYPAK